LGRGRCSDALLQSIWSTWDAISQPKPFNRDPRVVTFRFRGVGPTVVSPYRLR
jgi:hypothetical protein